VTARAGGRRGVRRRLAAVVAVVVAVVGVVVAPGAAYADDIRGQEWQLPLLHAQQAWHYSTGRGVTVAVLDSGVDATHPDLSGRVLPGIDLVDGSTDGRKDFVGHGTTVAGLIAGRPDGDGVEGLAYEAKILPVRVLDANNRYGDATTVANGVTWAVDHGAQVINMSLGGAAESDALASAIRYAFDHDVVVVACAGNVAEGVPTVWYPGRASGVVAVSALDPDENFWSGSLSGPQVALSAPGNGLVGARPSGYWKVQGTSFATPLVAATAALIRSRWPGMSAANVVDRLIRTADDLGPAGRDPKFGFGMVDPLKALTAKVPTVTTNPLDTAPPSASGSATATRPTLTTEAHNAAGTGTGPTAGIPRAAYLIAVAVVLAIAILVMLILVFRSTRAPSRDPPA
jgi:type VII secretion-associated serine protease mycosin